MATIKSYSDLQQSKKLAEILPLESNRETIAKLAVEQADALIEELKK